jgi:hypothetical protein
MRTRRAQIQPSDVLRRKEEVPIDHGHRTRRCRICNAFVCRYNDQPICWVHQPAGEGVLLEVAPGQWRRFTPTELLPGSDQLRADDFAELMAEV